MIIGQNHGTQLKKSPFPGLLVRMAGKEQKIL
jgi:hypothetical protein